MPLLVYSVLKLISMFAGMVNPPTGVINSEYVCMNYVCTYIYTLYS